MTAEIIIPLAMSGVAIAVSLFFLRYCRKTLEKAIWHHEQAQAIYRMVKEIEQ